MKNKNSLQQPLVSNPPYRGDLLKYIEEKQKDEEKEKGNKLASILDKVINHLETLRYFEKNI